ncbi:hypothetical protein C4568_04085 [Candidatus Parcubacteria bacterium]|nr:MAG: hypothetical protein C4568_04085 [Candidatus Parcubacteria bacterium]
MVTIYEGDAVKVEYAEDRRVADGQFGGPSLVISEKVFDADLGDGSCRWVQRFRVDLFGASGFDDHFHVDPVLDPKTPDDFPFFAEGRQAFGDMVSYLTMPRFLARHLAQKGHVDFARKILVHREGLARAAERIHRIHAGNPGSHY